MPFVNPMLFGTSGAQGAIVEFGFISEGGTPLGRIFLSPENEFAIGSIVSDPEGLFTVTTDVYGKDLIEYNFFGDYKFTLIQNYSSVSNLGVIYLTDGNTNTGLEQDIFQLYNGSLLSPSPVTITVDNDAGTDHFRPSYTISGTGTKQATGTLRIKVEYLG
jgi:hypothetical protein